MLKKIKETILDKKIIVIVRGVESEKLIPLAEAMYDGGIRLLEITYSADSSVSDEDIAANIKEFSLKSSFIFLMRHYVMNSTNKSVLYKIFRFGGGTGMATKNMFNHFLMNSPFDT